LHSARKSTVSGRRRESLHRTVRRTARRLLLDRIAGFLEVWRIDDSQEIVIQRADLKPDANRAARIVLSPRQARHLSSVLLMHAEEIEKAGRSLTRSAGSR